MSGRPFGVPLAQYFTHVFCIDGFPGFANTFCVERSAMPGQMGFQQVTGCIHQFWLLGAGGNDRAIEMQREPGLQAGCVRGGGQTRRRMGDDAAGAFKQSCEHCWILGGVGLAGQCIDHRLQHGKLAAMPHDPVGHLQCQVFDRHARVIDFQLIRPETEVGQTFQRMGAQFIDFLERNKLAVHIRAPADVQALADCISKQEWCDLLTGKRTGPLKCGDQGICSLFKGAVGGAIHSFSNFSDAELMQ